MEIVRVATCQLNQWALDFSGNVARTKESIRLAKKVGARFRTGPELELTGYGCEDHFLEPDTIFHSWACLAEILEDEELTKDILCDIGMPVLFRSVRYNCRVFCLNSQVLLIRPKIDLSGNGNYREFRYFTGWNSADLELYEFSLPSCVSRLFNQSTTLFGFGVIQCLNTTLGSETCEELWTPKAPHIDMMLDGVEIIANGSASHHELRKLGTRLDLILSATSKAGGVYLYSNQKGCDGGRLYFDGSTLIAVNGKIIKLAPQFGFKDIEVLHADVDLMSVRGFRAQIPSFSYQVDALVNLLMDY